MSDYDAGLAVRRAVLGDEYVDAALAGSDDFTAPFQDFITRFAWGDVWGRPGLDRRTRSCVTVALLAGLGHENELAVHLRLHSDFGRPHHANNCGGRLGTTLEVDQGTREQHEHDCADRGTPNFAHVAVLS